ncbi:hypothetical protein I5677_01590 [Mobilitalea sibirica]|uniref:Uncharacterized protein n=1 Tax=Mobilitalea sibirica TaxID=1462919 RepID=A0A8J7H0H0_9FIRM|nr:hypothetical protein [Mobilitalea sibirica]MBH1939583.1 hypothetical protein [Mobilitalea sibirica]
MGKYSVKVNFKEDCDRILLQAYDIINLISKFGLIWHFDPKQIFEISEHEISEYIKHNGINLNVTTKSIDKIYEELNSCYYLKDYLVLEIS